MSVVQQGLTIHAYQDGNRLILSFENVDDGLKTAILSMVGGVMLQSIEGLAAPQEIDNQSTYTELSDKVEEAIEDEAAAMFAGINVNDYMPETAEKEPTSKEEEVPQEPITTNEEKEGSAKESEAETPVSESEETVPTQEPVKEESEKDKAVPPESKEKETPQSKPNQTKRYAFNKGCFEKMTPEEVLEQNKLGAIKFFYDHRNEYPYSNKVMKREIAAACRKYIAKITKELNHVERAIIWLYENVSDIVVAEFQNMTQEEITKDVIINICKNESKEFCETIVNTLFSKIVEVIEK